MYSCFYHSRNIVPWFNFSPPCFDCMTYPCWRVSFWFSHVNCSCGILCYEYATIQSFSDGGGFHISDSNRLSYMLELWQHLIIFHIALLPLLGCNSFRVEIVFDFGLCPPHLMNIIPDGEEMQNNWLVKFYNVTGV